jgi:hypothetical protein
MYYSNVPKVDKAYRKKHIIFLNCEWFLGAFAKLQRATISFVMSVSPPFPLPAWNSSDPTEQFYEIWNVSILNKSVKEIKFQSKCGKNKE